MIWKFKTARIFFNYEVLADLNSVTVNTSVILVIYQKLKNDNAPFIQIKAPTM